MTFCSTRSVRGNLRPANACIRKKSQRDFLCHGALLHKRARDSPREFNVVAGRYEQTSEDDLQDHQLATQPVRGTENCRLDDLRCDPLNLRFISVATCSRPALKPSCANRPRSMQLPAKGNYMCSLSIRCISIRSASDTGRGAVIDTASADPQLDRLAADTELGCGIDHFLRSATDPPCRARRTKNHSQASALPSSQRSSRRSPVLVRPSRRPQKHQSHPQAANRATV